MNKASYKEIHYVISMLKQSNSLIENDLYNGIELTEIVVKLFKSFMGEKYIRQAFLLDILEEARERKRPQN